MRLFSRKFVHEPINPARYQDAVYEPFVTIGETLPPWKPTKWDDPRIKHLDGVAWHDAAVPPTNHACWPQTDALIGFARTQRCACGAIKMAPSPYWMERNSREQKRSA